MSVVLSSARSAAMGVALVGYLYWGKAPTFILVGMSLFILGLWLSETKRNIREKDNPMTQKIPKDPARTAAQKIILNLTDRRGLRQEYDMIDEVTRQEIEDTWTNIIANECSNEK